MTISQEEWTRRQRIRELRELPIPTEHRGKTFDDVIEHPGNAAAIAGVRSWLRGASHFMTPTSEVAGKGLLLFGPTGTGKTLLASVLAQRIVERSRRTGLVHFTTMEGFNRHRLRKMELGKVMDAGRSDESVVDEWMDHDRVMQRCYDVRLLVLDDIGQENTTEHLAKVLNELLRDRYARGCPTIITSNVNPRDWATRFMNESLGSFVFQACFVHGVAGRDGRVHGVG